LEVIAPARPAGPRLLGAAPEQPPEQVADVRAAGLTGRVEQVVEIEFDAIAKPAEATAATAESAAETAVGEKPPGFVVLLALLRVGEHLLGLGHRLVAFLGRRVARVSVGMVLREQ